MPKRVARWFEQWSLKHLPATLVARPFEWFTAILCGMSGLLIATRVSQPRVPENVLPNWAFELWSAVLIAGCLFMVCGLSSIRWVKPPMVYELRRPACYKFGLRLLGLGAATYGWALLTYGGWNALFPACMAAMFAAFCFVRLLTVAVRL